MRDSRLASRRNQPGSDAFHNMLMSNPSPSHDILPNIRELTWSTANSKLLRCASVFLSPSLQSFSVSTLRDGLLDEANALLGIAKKRCPKLSTLHLACPTCDPEMDGFEMSGVGEHLGDFMALEVIKFQKYHVTQKVLSALARLPRLRVLEQVFAVEDEMVMSNAAWEDFSDPDYAFVEGDFPALESLTIHEAAHSIVDLFAQPYFPKTIKTLKISTDYDPEELRALLELFKDFGLEELMIFMTRLDGLSESSEEPIPFIDIADLGPLTNLKTLRRFELWSHHALWLSETDYEHIAKGLPNIEELWLGEVFWQSDRFVPKTGMTALIPFVSLDVQSLRVIVF